MAISELPPYGRAVRRADPDRFFTALFAPPAHRDALWLLYAFNHELARARSVVSEPILALIRLQWWREVVEGASRRHELATPLAEALKEGRLARADLLEMIEGREVEAATSIATMSEWRAYVELSAGAVAVAAGRALGADAADFAGLRAVGSAYGTADLLRNVTRHAREGRCLLPEEALARHGLTLHDAIMAPERATAVVSELVAEGLRWDAAGRGRRHASLRAAALVGILARRDLRRMAKGAAASRGLVDRLAVTMAAAAGVPRI